MEFAHHLSQNLCNHLDEPSAKRKIVLIGLLVFDSFSVGVPIVSPDSYINYFSALVCTLIDEFPLHHLDRSQLGSVHIAST